MIINALLLLVPVSALLAYGLHAPPLWVFLTSILAIVPLADWVRRGTEQVAHRAGPAVGGLLNVSFGNAPELILALFVLLNGQASVVKAQITGSIIGNCLMGSGLAILVGCWGRERLTFNQQRAGHAASLLVLTMFALLTPAHFDYTERGVYRQKRPGDLDEQLSLGVAVVLLLVYLANLIYTFWTHRDLFNPGGSDEDPEQAWPLWRSIGIMALGTVVTAFEAELVSHSLEATAAQLQLTPFFLGVILLAVVGNAAEYASAIYFARRRRMGMALSITVGSSVQVALVVAPVLVLVSNALGHPMNLVFANPLELVAIAAAVLALNSISRDGEVTWFEGVLLLALYVVLGLAFFFIRS